MGLVFSLATVSVVALTVYTIYKDYRRHRAFAKSIGKIEDDEKATGILAKLRTSYKSSDTEGPVKFRSEMRDRLGKDHIWKLMPNLYYWVIHDPKIAQFMMNLDADLVEKAGMSKDIFRGDYNGFNNGLLMAEGGVWKSHRKMIGKYLSNHSIEAYIDDIDASAQTFVELLSKSSEQKARVSILAI